MNEELSSFIEESIKIELGVAELYLLFSMAYPKDSEFWWQLAVEEKNHAALIRCIKDNFMPDGLVPDKSLSSSIEELRSTNARICDAIASCRVFPPSRADAFQLASHLEEEAGELHFQKFMDSAPRTKIEGIFQRLNSDDRDHAKRIHTYMTGQS